MSAASELRIDRAGYSTNSPLANPLRKKRGSDRLSGRTLLQHSVADFAHLHRLPRHVEAHSECREPCDRRDQEGTIDPLSFRGITRRIQQLPVPIQRLPEEASTLPTSILAKGGYTIGPEDVIDEQHGTNNDPDY